MNQLRRVGGKYAEQQKKLEEDKLKRTPKVR